MKLRPIFAALSLLLLAAPFSRADVIISEFCADNDGSLYNGLGQADDWIEIHNPTAATVNLAGWKLRAGNFPAWLFPNMDLPAGGYLVVFASGRTLQPYTDPAGYLHTSFKLDASGEALALLRPNDTVAHEYPAPVPVQKKDISYGVLQSTTPLITFESAAKIFVPSSPVPDTWRSSPDFNDSAWTTGKSALGFGSPGFGASSGGVVPYRVATGIVGTQNYGGALGMDFVVNQTLAVTELGCFDSGGNGITGTITVQLWRRNENGTPAVFTDDTGQTMLASANFTTADPGTLQEGSRFKTLAAPLSLAPGAYTIVAWGYNAGELNGNAAGSPPSGWETDSVGGKITFVGGGRFGAAGSFPGTLDSGPVNRYAAGTFKCSGPNDPNIRTNLQSAMLGVNASAFVRVKFDVANPSAFTSLLLDLPSDDGCVVWLNGTEVARRNAPDPLAHNSAATQAAALRATIPIPASLLSPGSNLLAIQGLNVSASDPDFFAGAQLTGVTTDTATVRYFSAPTPGAPNPSTGALGYVADTKFSVDRGFFAAPFSLTITSATPEASIRYTRDGSLPSATVGTLYSGPIAINTTSVIRAIAYKTGLQTTNVDTQTYLFANDIAVQPGTPPAGYPSTWVENGSTSYTADYGMINSATSATNYALSAGNNAYPVAQARTAIANSIKALPVLSIVTDKANFFDPSTGIYLHASSRGDAWERPISLELITADGKENFQADAGVHIMGLTSRSLSVTPKLNMMIVFGTQYGSNWLNRSFFGPDGPSRVKRIALRSNTRDSWLAPYYGEATYMVDSWSKRAQLDSGHPATRDRFCHVFINGLYWGVYDPTERPEEHWAETALGGEDEDYDVLDLCCGNRLEAGDLVEWNTLMTKSTAGFASTAAYQDVQGNNPDGTRNPALKKLLGVDSAINFFLNGYYTASGDWPGNFFTAYDNVQSRTPGWRFITWDNDLSFQGFVLTANKVTPPEGFNDHWWLTSPGQVDVGLRQNIDYRTRLADTAYKFYFHGGPYDVAPSQARWNAIKAELQPGLYAESCRWGDYRGTLKTVQNHWLPRVTTTATPWFNGRTAAVISQMRSAGLYPNLNPPEFNQFGGVVAANFPLVFSATAGAGVYYSINGADPRLPGGAVAPAALTTTNGGTAILTQTCVVRARARNASEWSPLQEVTFVVGNAANAGELQITEFDYHPADPTAAEFNAGYTSGSMFEFIELTNLSAQFLDLTGVHFDTGVKFTFPAGRTIAPGASVLVVRNQAAFLLRYGAALAPLVAGEFAEDSGLSDSGEAITLLDVANAPIFTLAYTDLAPWPAGADGAGPSLVLTGTDPANPAHWRTSAGLPTPGERPSLATEWLRAHFTPAEQADPAISGDLADPDCDGLCNLAEFGTGSDPHRSDSGPDALQIAVETFEISGVPARYAVLKLRQTVEPGYTVYLEESTDLIHWTDHPVSLIPDVVTDLQNGWKISTYRSADPFDPATHINWRARITRP